MENGRIFLGKHPRSGQLCKIVRECNEDDIEAEMLPMFLVEFPDGERLKVFLDELEAP